MSGRLTRNATGTLAIAIGPILIGPVVIAALMSPVLLGSQRLAFRDVSHFYTPLYGHLGERFREHPWQFLTTPQWNPLDQTGMPLAGETATAVFYPVRILVYAIPASPEWLMGMYVCVHLMLGSVAAWWCVRRLGYSAVGCTIASLMYPLSGCVWFLATNPPYLVSAAWLPLALTGLVATQKQQLGLTERVGTPGVALAMMVLGGDPMTALHVLIVAAIWGIANWVVRRDSVFFFRSLGAMVFAGALAAMLSAPQIAASLSWAAQSDRAPALPDAQAYAFSLPPWRLLEMGVPNLFGTPWPINTRWDRDVFAAGQQRPENALWTPSIYCGVFGLWATLITLRQAFRSRQAKITLSTETPATPRKHMIPWLTVGAFALVASMGAYGPAYWLRAVVGWPESTHGAVAGPFWWLRECLPGYETLRYPSKWLPLVAFVMAIISASFVSASQSETIDKPCAGRKTWWLIIAILGGVAAWLVWCVNSLDHVSADPLWGPLNVSAAKHGLLLSLSSLVVWFSLMHLCQRKRWGWGLVVIVALDLVIAHRSMIPTIDRSLETQLFSANSLRPQSSRPATTRWMRTKAGEGQPNQWRTTSSGQRLLETEASQRSRWSGRWHLLEQQAMFNSIVSIRPQAIATFWNAALNVSSAMSPTEQQAAWTAWREWIGVNGVVTLTEETIHHHVEGNDYLCADARRRETSHPQLRWHRHCSLVSENWRNVLQQVADNESRQGVMVRLDEIHDPETRQLLGELGADDSRLSELQSVPDPMIRSVSRGPASETIDIDTEQRIVISRRQLQDGHWRAFIAPAEPESSDWKSTEVFTVDLLSQAVLVPAGNWRLRLEYQPWFHLPTVLVSLLTWLGCLIIATLVILRTLGGHGKSPG